MATTTTKNAGNKVGKANLSPRGRYRAERLQQKAKRSRYGTKTAAKLCSLDARFVCDPDKCPPAREKLARVLLAATGSQQIRRPRCPAIPEQTDNLPDACIAETIRPEGYEWHLQQAQRDRVPYKEVIAEDCRILQVCGAAFICFDGKKGGA